MKHLLAWVTRIGADPNDSEELRLQKSLLVICSLPFSFAGLSWGVMYFLFGEPGPALIPFSYGIVSLGSIAYFGFTRRYRFLRFSQLLLILLLPSLLMASLGGFVNGSAVVLWAVICPFGAIVFDEPRRARYWMLAYLAILVVSGLIQPFLRPSNNLSGEVRTFFFVINLIGVSGFICMMAFYSVKKRDEYRKLERSYLRQEVMLRESEKLATLGRLSAGMAHEINNPASSAVRGSKLLQENVQESEQLLFALGGMQLSGEQLQALASFQNRRQELAKSPLHLAALERSDRESAMESWLEERNVEPAWDVASMLVSLGFEAGDLSPLEVSFSEEQLPIVLNAMRNIDASHALADEICKATGRISGIVKALKSYSFMDQAPIKAVDVHEGIRDTLVMLRSRLQDGVVVEEEFDQQLPRIQASGGELNQVWTNLIINAVEAMDGRGTLSIETFRDGPWLVVRIEDSGPGIAPRVASTLFDPFVTTKKPGQGTGLGLNISHNIVVQNHKGEISVESGARGAKFEVRLPLDEARQHSEKAPARAESLPARDQRSGRARRL